MTARTENLSPSPAPREPTRQPDGASTDERNTSSSPAPTTNPPEHSWHLWHGDALTAYPTWPAPTTIISDGAYGIRGFHGDTATVETLPAWYEPHITAWTRAATPATTLWLWNTEIGWATLHPHLIANGWEYIETIIWDKGVAHIAGNVNSKTIRRFPVVTETCALYQRKPVGPGGEPLREWLRNEWQRAGIPLNRANTACGVRNAATRKYLSQDHHWYNPPGIMFERLAHYANTHGEKEGRPYYTFNGSTTPNAHEWDSMRYVWTHQHATTNVWTRGPLHDTERVKGTLRRSAPRVHNPTPASAAHLNQKPLEFMERSILAVTKPGNVVWEPFGGLASASVAAVTLGRKAYVAEVDSEFVVLARKRLREAENLSPPNH